MYKGKHTRTSKPGPDQIRPYGDLVDIATLKGWTTHLDFEMRKGLWTLDLRDGDDVIVRVRSTKKPAAAAFRELGALAAAAVSRSGRG
jgi:hypothetical protein